MGKICVIRIEICCLLILLLIGGFLVTPSTPVAALVYHEGDFDYIVSGSGATITGYNGSGGVITIPSTLGGFTTVAIGDYAFSSPKGVFVTSFTLPKSVNSIGEGAFMNTGLTQVTITSSIANIGWGAFAVCNSLVKIDVDTANPRYASMEGVLYDKAINTLIQYPGHRMGHFSIPNSVTSIGDLGFFNCKLLSSVAIGTSVTSIGNQSFTHCDSLTSITLPDSVITLGLEAFARCDYLASVTLGAGINFIDGMAFAYSGSLSSITFLGMAPPTTVQDSWIIGVHAEIRGHAYANSSFPAPGEVFKGLTMGEVISVEPEPAIDYTTLMVVVVVAVALVLVMVLLNMRKKK
jgi:hypothetical protein